MTEQLARLYSPRYVDDPPDESEPEKQIDPAYFQGILPEATLAQNVLELVSLGGYTEADLESMSEEFGLLLLASVTGRTMGENRRYERVRKSGPAQSKRSRLSSIPLPDEAWTKPWAYPDWFKPQMEATGKMEVEFRARDEAGRTIGPPPTDAWIGLPPE